MTKEQPTRRMVRLLKDAGFVAIRSKGSHTVYSYGDISITVPDGHRTVSPGVVREIEKAIAASKLH